MAIKAVKYCEETDDYIGSKVFPTISFTEKAVCISDTDGFLSFINYYGVKFRGIL